MFFGRGLVAGSVVESLSHPTTERLIRFAGGPLPSVALCFLVLEGIHAVELFLSTCVLPWAASSHIHLSIGSIFDLFEFVNTISVDDL